MVSGFTTFITELNPAAGGAGRRRVKKPHPRPSGRPLSVDGEGHYEVKG